MNDYRRKKKKTRMGRLTIIYKIIMFISGLSEKLFPVVIFIALIMIIRYKD